MELRNQTRHAALHTPNNPMPPMGMSRLELVCKLSVQERKKKIRKIRKGEKRDIVNVQVGFKRVRQPLERHEQHQKEQRMEAVTIGCSSLRPLLRNVGVGKFPPMNSQSSFDRMLHKLTCRQNTL